MRMAMTKNAVNAINPIKKSQNAIRIKVRMCFINVVV
jgi:hypothetical protein